MVTGETGHHFLTVLISVAEVLSIVYGIVIILALYLAVTGAQEMTQIFSHATMNHAQVTPRSNCLIMSKSLTQFL